MAFSQGFNNTFRSLDNSFQTRANRDENARQFDATLDEKKRVNDSRIDVNAAQIGRLSALTKQVDQAVEHNEQMNPKLLDLADEELAGQKALNTYQEHQNDAAAFANQKTEATMDSAIAAENAKNVRARVDEEIVKAQNQGTHANDVLKMFQNEDGSPMDATTIASDPRLASRFISVASASDAIFDDEFGKNSIGTLVPDYDEDGNLWYYAVQEDQGEDGNGAPLRPDPDMVDENGEPLRMSPDEVAEAVNAARERLDSYASLGARGGSSRRRLGTGIGIDTARSQAGPPPEERSLPPEFADMSEDDLVAQGTELEAEVTALQEKRDELQSRVDRGSNNIGRRARQLDQDYEEQVEELDTEVAALNERLRGISGALETMQYNDALPQTQAAFEQGIQQQGRRLGDAGIRAETVSGENMDSTAFRNQISTGRPDMSPEEAMADYNKKVGEMEKVFDKVGTRLVPDGKGGQKQVTDQRAVEHLKSQFHTLAYTDPSFRAMVQNENTKGLVRKLGLDATDLAGAGNQPNLLVAWYSSQTGVSAEKVGPAAQIAMKLANPDGGSMGAEQQAQVVQATAQAMVENPHLDDEAVAQRAVLTLQNAE